MTQPRAEQVLPGVYRIDCPFGDGGIVHVYYLDTPEPALIDTGVKRSVAEAIGPALEGAGFDVRAIQHVFNTHGHWDHMGGNGALKQVAPQARFYIHAADRHLLEDLRAHTHGYTTYPAWLMNDQAGLAQQQETLRQNIDVPVPADVLVEDGQTIPLGGSERVTAVFSPGHSLGSTSYLLESNGALFTGDGVQGKGSRPGILPLIFEDSRAYRATMAKLSDVSFQALCLGHSFVTVDPSLGREPVRRGEAARAYLVESGEAAKAVEEAMRSALQSGAPAGDFPAVARETLARVAGPLDVEVDGSGLSSRCLATLHSFYRELTGAARPA